MKQFFSGYVSDLSNDSLRLPGSVRNFLVAEGYKLGIHRPPYSSVNSVAKFRDTLSSHSDTRGGGLAARLYDGSNKVDQEDGNILQAMQSGITQGETDAGDKDGATVDQQNQNEAAEVVQEESPFNSAGIHEADGKDSVTKDGDAEIVSLGDASLTANNRSRYGSGLRTGEEYKQGERLFLGEFSENTEDDNKSSQVTAKEKEKDAENRRKPGVNKKYMGDAVQGAKVKTASTSKADGGTEGTGIVVKGDKRGGGGDVTLTSNSPDVRSRFINGGRGSNGNFNLFMPKGDTDGGDEDAGAANGGLIDSVFSDYDPLRHFSYGRVDDYNTDYAADGEASADYVEAPINIWGHQQRQLIPRHRQPQPHRIILSPEHAEQLNRQLQQQHHQLQQQRQQQIQYQLQQHIQKQQASSILNEPVGSQRFIPLQPQQGGTPPQERFIPLQSPSRLPVIVQTQRDHLHPVLGSVISGRYSDIQGR